MIQDFMTVEAIDPLAPVTHLSDRINAYQKIHHQSTKGMCNLLGITPGKLDNIHNFSPKVTASEIQQLNQKLTEILAQELRVQS